MFNEADQRTAFDLNFTLFRVPVRVHPFFWIIAALLGQVWYELWGFPYLVLWIVCVFVSVLLHELGHALTGRAFGNRPHIVLFSFGGLAIGATDPRNRRWQRIAVIAAGPGIQLALFVVLWGVVWWLSQPQLPGLHNPFGTALFLEVKLGEPLARMLLMLLVINLVWPILNLLPIWPLDGGQITREVVQGVRPRDGVLISLVISAVVSGVLAVHFLLAIQGRGLPFLGWLPGSYFNAIFMLLFCVGSLQLIHAERARMGRRYYDDRFPWE